MADKAKLERISIHEGKSFNSRGERVKTAPLGDPRIIKIHRKGGNVFNEALNSSLTFEDKEARYFSVGEAKVHSEQIPNLNDPVNRSSVVRTYYFPVQLYK